MTQGFQSGNEAGALAPRFRATHAITVRPALDSLHVALLLLSCP